MRNVDSNMICHGKSGIVSICILFRKLTKTRKFDTFINNYTDEIESIFDKDIQNLGFLEGTTGIILTLNECFSNKGKTQWMKSLMLFDDF